MDFLRAVQIVINGNADDIRNLLETVGVQTDNTIEYKFTPAERGLAQKVLELLSGGEVLSDDLKRTYAASFEPIDDDEALIIAEQTNGDALLRNIAINTVSFGAVSFLIAVWVSNEHNEQGGVVKYAPIAVRIEKDAVEKYIAQKAPSQ